MAATILVVEDEPAIQELIAYNLKQAGHQPLRADNAEQAMNLVQNALPDLVLLDWMLPGQSGIDFARRLRSDRRTRTVPIIMLTARTDEQDKLTGLDTGADDYITKPFRIGELIARVKALLRRRPPSQSVVRFGDCEVDPHARRVLRNGREIALTSKEFRLLMHFVARPGRALSRDAILNAVWGNLAFVTDRSIDRCVATLRAKIEPHPHKPTYIHTIRDVGYRFEPD